MSISGQARAELERQLARTWLCLRQVELAADAANEEGIRCDAADMLHHIQDIQTGLLKAHRLKPHSSLANPPMRIPRT